MPDMKTEKILISALDISIVFMLAFVVIPIIHESGHLAMANLFSVKVKSYNLFSLSPTFPFLTTPYVEVADPHNTLSIVMFNLGGLASTMIVFVPYALYTRHVQDKERYVYSLAYIGVSLMGAESDLESVSQVLTGVGVLGIFLTIIPCAYIIYHVAKGICFNGSCEIVLTENGKEKST